MRYNIGYSDIGVQIGVNIGYDIGCPDIGCISEPVVCACIERPLPWLRTAHGGSLTPALHGGKPLRPGFLKDLNTLLRQGHRLRYGNLQ